MSTPAPLLCRTSEPGLRFVISTLILTFAAFATGCGSSSMSKSSAPVLSGNTLVSVVLTSTANDQIPQFDVGFQNISLTTQSGSTVSLLSSPNQAGAEFIHLNGIAEPLAANTIPQGIYTSASITLFGAEFVCIALGPVDGEESLNTDWYSILSTAPVTVAVPTPITVTGKSMALSLNLEVAQSATLGDCVNVDGFSGFSLSPSFSLNPLDLSSMPTSAANGKVTGTDGQISAIGMNGTSFTLTVSDLKGPRSVSVNADGNTVYQGLSGFSPLAMGTFVNMDGAIQTDGSLLATRIAVEDPFANDIVRGPVIQVANSVSSLFLHAREQQGKDLPGYVSGFGPFTFGSAAFQISGQFTNLKSLPFVPSFTASNIVPGQEVYISAASIPNSGGVYPVASTLTLMPQTINGTVLGSTQAGNFTDYTVTLASYDLFPMLAEQPGQTTVESNPSEVEVYVDSHTELLNSQALAVGGTLRFYGLVFNDNGTLRMDCAQVTDGVAFLPPPSSSSSQTQREVVRGIEPSRGGLLHETVSTVIRQHQN